MFPPNRFITLFNYFLLFMHGCGKCRLPTIPYFRPGYGSATLDVHGLCNYGCVRPNLVRVATRPIPRENRRSIRVWSAAANVQILTIILGKLHSTTIRKEIPLALRGIHGAGRNHIDGPVLVRGGDDHARLDVQKNGARAAGHIYRYPQLRGIIIG